MPQARSSYVMSMSQESNEQFLTIDQNLDACAAAMQHTLKDKVLSLDCISTQLQFLLGEILTIVDASVVDSTQRKAVKDLVKSKFYSRNDWFIQLGACSDGSVIRSMNPDGELVTSKLGSSKKKA